MRRVFVASIGAITPLGSTWRESLPRLASAETAVAAVESFDTSGFPSSAAAQLSAPLPASGDRRTQLARLAAAEAFEQFDLGDVARERVGVFIGAESGRATPQTILALARAAGGGELAKRHLRGSRGRSPQFDHRRFGARATSFKADIDAAALSPAAVAARLAGDIGALGPVNTVSLACASGAVAIADAARAIRAGRVDVAICGGVGADVDPLMMVGFGKLGALSARGASRPFDIRRDGFVVGEGAAIIILSAAESDVELTGVGLSLDAHHLTAPDPEGAGAARAMSAALADAGHPDIEYVQAHGTSTPKNDEVEAAAIARVAPRGERTAVSSIKGALGHWVAGAGAIGFACGVEAIRGIQLPTAGLEQPDPRCALDHIVSARRESVRAAMINSFAFGGANCSLIVEATR